MKIFFITALFIGICSFTEAQLVTPQPSPLSKVEQIVGLTEVHIEYSRPGTKGRTIFGDLVPYEKIWRTGANASTNISFNDDVVIGGKTLKSGKYALYTTPKADSWEVIFYKDISNWGLPEKWDDSKVALSTTVKPEKLSGLVETFTIDINNLNIDNATLDISWEKTKISVPFTVPTETKTKAAIDKVLSGPTAYDYYSAANYYFQADLEIDKALVWINNAVALIPADKDVPFFYLRLKSLIQAKKGDKKGAIETAKQSIEAATKAGNADYVKMNKDSIAEWSK